MLLQAHPQLALLKNIECAAVISAGGDDPEEWHKWSDESKQKGIIADFKLPLGSERGNLAILCVQRMLLTGFDVPVLQGLYLVGDAVKPSGYLMVEGVAQSVNQFLDLLDAIEQGRTDGPPGVPHIRHLGGTPVPVRNVVPPPSRLNALRWLWEAPGNSRST